MNIDSVLSRLDKVKSRGKDKWIACCPAHDDKNPSLAISIVDDTVLFKCFSGCGGVEVMEALEVRGCQKEDFFPYRPQNRSSLFATPEVYYSQKQLEELELQVHFLHVYAEDRLQGKNIAANDLNKARRCYASIKKELSRLANSAHSELCNRAKYTTTMIQDLSKRYG